MNSKEFVKFLYKHAYTDRPVAYLARLVRFGVIALNMHKVKDVESGQRYVERDICGSKMMLDSQDLGLSQELMREDIREPYATKYFQSFIKSSDVVLDIGANIGYYALQEAKKCAKVYAVEPVKENCELLYKNIKLNNYANISVHRIACGDKNESTFINVSQHRNWSSIDKVNSREFVDRQEVMLMTVDDFIKDKQTPNVIRMDVEGYEYEIILGMYQTLQSKKPMRMFIEWHLDILGQRKNQELARILKSNGFEIVCATVEPHHSLRRSKIGLQCVKWLEKRIGASTGYIDVTLKDIMNDRKYYSGQVEYLEIFLERK